MTKRCSKCGEIKDENYDNFYYVNKSKPELGFASMCKECMKKDSLKYHAEHKADHNVKHREYINEHREEMNEVCRQWRKENKPRKRKYYNDYMKRNRDKALAYRESRLHKKHDITQDEWNLCKQFFQNECAYCGLKLEEHYRIYRSVQQKADLHKDHAINDGSNRVDNCIPCCLMCNSNKWKSDYSEWYVETNPVFSPERYQRIVKWLQINQEQSAFYGRNFNEGNGIN